MNLKNYILSKRNEFVKSEGGNMATMAAITIFAILSMVAVAIDSSSLYSDKADLQYAADAAVLAVAMEYRDGNTKKRKLKKLAAQHVAGNLGGKWHEDDFKKFKLKIHGDRAEISFTAQTDLLFKGILGKDKTKISVVSEANLNAEAGGYSQFIFFVDVSNSMSRPSSPQGVADWKAVSGGCDFVCHDSNPSVDNIKRAHDMGIKLQMDVIRDEIQDFVDKIDNQNFKTYSRVSIHTVGSTYETLAANLTNGATINDKVKKLEVEPSHPKGIYIGPEKTADGWSYLEQGFGRLRTSLHSIGDGSDENHRKTYVIFLTDGLDSYPPYRTFGPRYAAECAALKQRGVELYTIETVYPDSSDIQIINKRPNIPVTLKNCASTPDHYFQAQNGSDISGAFDDILSEVMPVVLRLTH